MKLNRRTFASHSAIGIFGLIPSSLYQDVWLSNDKIVSDSYPSTDRAAMKAVVGAAHTKLDIVKELVMARPELAKASYDWGFGDVESALGAASHMGRKDIAEFLIEYGARPDIYTFAMLGKLNTVKAMIEDMPGIETVRGPHGFTLFHHAMMRLRRKNVEGQEKEEQEELVAYLESIEGANVGEASLDISTEEKQIYLGTYQFGDKDEAYFEVEINGMDMLSISRPNQNGRSLKKVGEHTFAPAGAPSVRLIFTEVNDTIQSLTIHDPTPIIKAIRL